jgi:excisionase family DNA binding protein
MATMKMDEDEIRSLAHTIVEIIYPQLEELIKGKSRWTVNELSALQGEWLSVKELSEMFSVSEKHIRNLINEGMPHVWVGNTIRIERKFIEGAIKDGRLGS